MSIGLVLYPIGGAGMPITSSHNILTCERDNDLFEKIDKLVAVPLPADFKVFHFNDEDEYIYGPLTTDGWGNQVMCLRVWELLIFEPRSDSQTNKAIWAYLKELPPNEKIALYWY